MILSSNDFVTIAYPTSDNCGLSIYFTPTADVAVDDVKVEKDEKPKKPKPKPKPITSSMSHP